VAETGLLLGATDWCTHPAGLQVMRVRGTKNPDRTAVIDLRPDLVVANQEENRELDVRRLRAADVPVWVTQIETVPQALSSLRRIFTDALGSEVPSWLTRAESLWPGPPPPVRARVAVAIWRDPWIAVGPRTFTGDVLRRLGLLNVFDTGEARYPHVELGQLDAGEVDFVILPDEPYVFTSHDGLEAFTRTRTVLVNGRMLTWYGPSLVEAHAVLTRQLSGRADGGP
jgi:ABC-type Fe3+-hydroxamate transport system substrate-binding protein